MSSVMCLHFHFDKKQTPENLECVDTIIGLPLIKRNSVLKAINHALSCECEQRNIQRWWPVVDLYLCCVHTASSPISSHCGA